jgi:hypothetical protein
MLNAVDHIQDTTRGFEACMAQKELMQKILKEYFEIP